jgi:hypothetical protein
VGADVDARVGDRGSYDEQAPSNNGTRLISGAAPSPWTTDRCGGGVSSPEQPSPGYTATRRGPPTAAACPGPPLLPNTNPSVAVMMGVAGAGRGAQRETPQGVVSSRYGPRPATRGENSPQSLCALRARETTLAGKERLVAIRKAYPGLYVRGGTLVDPRYPKASPTVPEHPAFISTARDAAGLRASLHRGIHAPRRVVHFRGPPPGPWCEVLRAPALGARRARGHPLGAANQRGSVRNLRRRATRRGGHALPFPDAPLGVGRTPPSPMYGRLNGDLRPGHLLRLRDKGGETVPRRVTPTSRRGDVGIS